MKKKAINIKMFFLYICIYILLFQNFLQNYIPIIQYYDELLSILAIPIAIIYMVNKGDYKIKKYNIYIVVLYLTIVFCGFFSSFRYNLQPDIAVFSDFLLVSKFFLTYFLSEMLFDIKLINHEKAQMSRSIKCTIIVFFILSILNFALKIWPQKSYRFGIMSNQLFYSHPTYLAAAGVFLLALLIITTEDYKKYAILIAFILISTLRIKAIGSAFIILSIIIFISKSNKKITISKIGLLSVVIILLAWNQISYYYIDLDGSARKVLNETSIKIAMDYFPLGIGFATFGSHFSMVYYSSVYYLYGINNVWGLVEGQVSYASDVFWPMILGQFGFVGLIAYVLFIFVLYRKIQDGYSKNEKNLYISKIICLTYLLISSTSESAFVNSIAIPLALVIGINNYDYIDEKTEK